jgi:hypothetical protein
MTYDKHIFISYAHLDNQPLTAEQEGWVSRFHESLQTILTMRMGRKAQIWRDKKLCGNDSFADEIVAQFPRTEILLSVLSKCYVESEWCMREVQEFCRLSGDVRVGNKYRIIKVIKLPFDSCAPLPPFMNEMLGYDFFTYQDPEQSRTPLELDPFYFPTLRPLYIEKLCKLADDVIDVIKRIESATPKPDTSPQNAPARPQIFLAVCSRDQKEMREALEMDLRQHGYPILPGRQLPNEEADFVADVSQLLDHCSLSVHIIGGFTGFVPDGPSRRSAVVLQNELAIARSKKRALRRVIWLPEGTVSQDPDQKQFIEALHGNADTQFGADLITGDLEALKAAVHGALRSIGRDETQNIDQAASDDLKLVYVICDEKDRETVLPLRKLLRSSGFDTKIPLFEGDAATVDHATQEILSQCNVALVFYGKGDELWKHAVDSDLLKSKAHRRDKRPLVKLTYLSAPSTAEKAEMIELEEPRLINGLQGLSEGTVKTLLEMLQVEIHRAA